MQYFVECAFALSDMEDTDKEPVEISERGKIFQAVAMIDLNILEIKKKRELDLRGKENVVAYALNKKNLGSVASFITQPHLISDLEWLGIELHVRGSGGSIASLKVEPNLILRVKEAQNNDTGLEVIRSGVAGDKQKHFRVDDEGVIWLGNKLCVPADLRILEEILKEAHISSFYIHPGSTKMKNDVIWVVVGRLTKFTHFLPIRETTHVHELTEIFQRHIVRLHSVPLSIVSDMDTRFTSHFWKGFQQDWGTRLNFSIAYHPQNDGQSEWTIQTLEDMLRACALEWTGDWDKCMYLDEVGERVIEGPQLVRITNKKVEKVKESLKEARSRQKSYVDQHRKFGGFEPGEHVFLKVSPCKGVKHFGMKGNLSPRYVGPFDIMEKVGEVSYRVALPPQLSHLHNVFQVSVLRGYKYHLLHIVQYPLHKIREDLSCEEEAEAILAREERVLRKNFISFIKVLWKSHSEREATWELEESIHEKYPHLFDSGTSI
ncbi:uncharacterized protein LOC141685241 [Apium graveolens]|uniref:uncharacterized protein LOC141685241 n=1 Tax=Apium graveolens TaxID=4045 RepID=UPI003D7BF7D5